jgi:hypothetical protein
MIILVILVVLRSKQSTTANPLGVRSSGLHRAVVVGVDIAKLSPGACDVKVVY